MARRRSSSKGSPAPKRVKGLPKSGRLYGSGARKAASRMISQYGQKEGLRIFYSLANKRAGKGARGAHRMHTVASSAYAKGSHWGGRGKSKTSSASRKGSTTRARGRSMSVQTRGRANVTRRSRGSHVRIRVN